MNAPESAAMMAMRQELASAQAACAEATRECEERLCLALSAGGLGHWQMELADLSLTASDQCKADFGVAPDEPFDAKVFRSRLHPDDRERADAAFERATREGGRFEAEYRCVWPDGTLHWVNASARVLVGADGRAARMVGVTRDVTARKHGDEALRQRSAEFEALFNATPDGAYLVDADFRVRAVNPAGLPAFRGMPDLIGKDLDLVMHELWRNDLAIEVVQRFRHTLATGEPFCVPEFVAQRRVGGPLEHYEWRLNRVPLPGGRHGVVCFFRGISAEVLARRDILESREQVQRSETRYRRLYEAAKDGILILDAGSARITDANPFIAELLGYTHANLVGKELWQIGFFKDIDENKAAMRTLQETHYIRYEDLPLKTTDGRLIDVEFVSNVYTEGAQQVIQCNVRDITERKRLENEARRYAEELRESDRHKDEFLAMLGHELRNPLAPIRNALHIMRLTASDNPAVQSVAQMMERQVAQMVRLVDDLLDVSRVSRGTIELRKETVDLASVINDAVEASRPMCESMGHRLAVTLPPQPVWLDADPSRLVQVVGNLLNNACKFTERGGRIGLSVALEDGQAVIRVRDSGVGIGADQLPRVFDLFMQVDRSLGRSVSGLGLGLTLVKNLIEIHDGTVQAHSAGLGQGSEFVVRLPVLATVTQAAPKPVAAEPAGQRAQRVLVVDDNQDAAQSLATLLQLSGFETTTVYDGLEAVAAAAAILPDVVLLDIGLPTLNGFEVAAKLRQQPGGAAMVLVALTGWGQEQDRRKSSDAGFDHHLVKPVDIDDLMKLLVDLPLAVPAS